MGQQSTLHAIKITKTLAVSNLNTSTIDEAEEGKPLSETLTDQSFSNNDDTKEKSESEPSKVHFFVYCSTCKALKSGKLRVRCQFCKSGAFTVHSDPQNWADVLENKRITGLCENSSELCADVGLKRAQLNWFWLSLMFF